MPRSRGLRKCNAVFAKKKVVAKYETKDFSFFIPIGRKGRNPRKQRLFSFWHYPNWGWTSCPD